ncbi:oxidoreductase [Sphaeroforma arctica JP610]|uniref:Peroxisomal trans-2-enoyl-CoA reductase n=1 Tax=Sphaeroforma arctica JP610 TaxID=667725 RepID=A0A0L0FFL5_9EUKA|nr:oxidoreductase [Sphaeroforma arctica JP610]KNC75545.1 oxidoreductase [Sphaeroforma arctica JP610]|eukprot:XP_014149447.1 oxidoreductase [Sphaeroforma arctica JP610]
MTFASIYRPGLFASKRFIVTGGGSGIGRCIAHELASLGASVSLIGRSQHKLEKTAKEIADDNGNDIVSWHTCDIRDEDRVKQVMGEILQQGSIAGLVNNAGGQFPAPLANISKKGFESVVSSNLTGGFLFSRELLNQSIDRDLISNEGCSIVNIVADMWGGMPGMGHSGAARMGMVNLTQTAAVEWAKYGYRVNAVAPGWIASSGFDAYSDPHIKKVLPKLGGTLPVNRLGTESEVSAAVCFLLGEGSAFITGTTLQVDGGRPLNNHPIMAPPAQHDNNKPFTGFHRHVTSKLLGGPGE